MFKCINYSMATEFEPHKLNLHERELKCFKYLCEELKTNVSERTRLLIKKDLKENEGLILRAIENQRRAIEKRAKEKD